METPGAVIGASSMHDAPAPLPFTVTTIRKAECVWFERQDLLYIFEQCTPVEAKKLSKCLQDEHNKILDSLKSRDIKGTRGSIVAEDSGDGDGEHREQLEAPGQTRLDLHRLAELDESTKRMIERVHALNVQAQLIPSMVTKLRERMGKATKLDAIIAIRPDQSACFEHAMNTQ